MGDDDSGRRPWGLDSARRRRAQDRRTPAAGVDEVTDPGSILVRNPSDVDLEILRRLGIPADAPVTMGQMATLISREHRREVESKSGNRELGQQIAELRELLQTPPNALTGELDDRVGVLERDAVSCRASALAIKADASAIKTDYRALRKMVRRARGVAIAAILAALGSVGAFGIKVWERAKEEGERIIRLDHVERDLFQLRQDLREDRSRYHPQPKDPS